MLTKFSPDADSRIILIGHLALLTLLVLPSHLERILQRLRRLLDRDSLAGRLAVNAVPHRGRVAHSNTAGRDVLGDNAAGADGRVRADGDSRENRHASADPHAVTDYDFRAPAAWLARHGLAPLLERDRVADADDGHARAEGALLADDDVGDRGVEDGAVAVDEGRWRDLHAQAVVHVDGLLDVGDCWARPWAI